MELTMDSNDHPELYQLIGPMEQLYQLVPIGQIDLEFGSALVPVPTQQSIIGHLLGNIDTDTPYELLALPNRLEAPIQLLAIEGPPQYQLVGPVPRLARIRCRFANDSHRPVDLVWTDNNYRMYHYAKLAHTDFVDITTFEGHQWVFCDALDGEFNFLNPGRVKKFIATNGDNLQRSRLRVSAISSVEGLTLKRIIFRFLASTIFERCNSESCSSAQSQSIGRLLDTFRLPICIKVQLANFLISCILYQLKFESTRLDYTQKLLLDGLVHFVRSKIRSYYEN